MTKLLDADWLRGVQLFHCFFKTNKMANRRNLTTNEIALEETKMFFKIRTKHQMLAKSLAEVEYDVYIEN